MEQLFPRSYYIPHPAYLLLTRRLRRVLFPSLQSPPSGHLLCPPSPCQKITRLSTVLFSTFLVASSAQIQPYQYNCWCGIVSHRVLFRSLLAMRHKLHPHPQLSSQWTGCTSSTLQNGNCTPTSASHPCSSTRHGCAPTQHSTALKQHSSRSQPVFRARSALMCTLHRQRIHVSLETREGVAVPKAGRAVPRATPPALAHSPLGWCPIGGHNSTNVVLSCSIATQLFC